MHYTKPTAESGPVCIITVAFRSSFPSVTRGMEQQNMARVAPAPTSAPANPDQAEPEGQEAAPPPPPIVINKYSDEQLRAIVIKMRDRLQLYKDKVVDHYASSPEISPPVTPRLLKDKYTKVIEERKRQTEEDRIKKEEAEKKKKEEQEKKKKEAEQKKKEEEEKKKAEAQEEKKEEKDLKTKLKEAAWKLTKAKGPAGAKAEEKPKGLTLFQQKPPTPKLLRAFGVRRNSILEKLKNAQNAGVQK
ncbi:hypothetical protein D9C73_022077 [Collichthys lucidus]|uniref:Uncharacterized protein n=1 Tax=Collichthys lucidus TaxID=240159 RepID=A0A4U5VI04_COLLU|nr:hypothetical protein D9C73_022077 [Collichthys lucidus]